MVKVGSSVIVAILFFYRQDINTTFQHLTRIVENPTLAPTVYFDCPVKVVRQYFKISSGVMVIL